MKIKDYSFGSDVNDLVVRLSDVHIRKTTSGADYASMLAYDGTDTIEAKIWSFSDEIRNKLSNGEVYKVVGKFKDYQGKMQLNITDIELVGDDVDKSSQKIVTDIVKGTKSTVHFIKGNHDFDNSNRRKWPVAMWYRLMLPKLLPNVSRIIYADLDIIFCHDLIDVYETDLGNNVIAAVPTRTDHYFNSGFLLMDLDKIRKEKFYPKWIKSSVEHDYKNPDQDVLNETLRGRVLFLPLKYNFQLSHGSRIFKIYSEAELDDLKHNLVTLHYSDYIKPWGEAGKRPVFSAIWWDVAKKTGLFEEK